ncbi:MAG: glycosyltransferase family 2 protein [Bacteroidales bacterium]|nr:glycosyltransferase family 2 protein [Bacteroidales bacterium]
MAKHLSVVIPVHNSIGYTKQCLKNIVPLINQLNENSLKTEIIVVDDGSADGTSDYIRNNYPSVHLLSGDGTLWWSGGAQKGMDYALDHLQTDFILWWNNDILASEDYFTQLADLLKNSSEDVVYGSKIYNAEAPQKIWTYGGFFHSIWGHSYTFGRGESDGPEFSKAIEADWLPGMGTVLSKEIIKKTGRINIIEFPQYHADVDYTYRAKLAGYKVMVIPELKIWNHTRHSGRTHNNKISGLFSTLHDIKSQYHFDKEWLLYKKYATTPLAYLMLIKRYLGYFIKFLIRKPN